jgi:hypothetical protein
VRTWKRKNDGALTRRTVNDILEEIHHLKNKKQLTPGKYVIFDNPITANDNNFIITLAQNIITAGIQWIATVNPNELTQKECAVLKDSGCIASFSGAQLSFDTLMRFLPALTINPKNTEKLKNNNILTVAFYTLPPNMENLGKIQKHIEKNNADVNRFHIYTPLPGSPEFYALDAKNKILTYDWTKYDANHVVLNTINYCAKSVEIIHKKLIRKHYSIMAKLRDRRQNIFKPKYSPDISAIKSILNDFIKATIP